LRWAVAGLLLVRVLLWLAVPPLVKREIEREGTAALGRTVSVGAVGFHPWSLRLTVDDLKIGTADGHGWQFTLARLEANLELESLLRVAPVLDSLVLDLPLQPHLAFELNDSSFDTALQGTPFDASHAMEARLKVPQFDLAPWLAYVPADLAIRPTAGMLDADLLRTHAVAAELEDVRPPERVATLASLTLEAPTLQWVRKRESDMKGRLKVALLDAPAPVDATEKIAAYAHSTGAAGQNDAKSPTKADDWKLALHALHIQRGQVRYSDENFKPVGGVALADVDVQATALQWPLTEKPIAFTASANAPTKGKASRLQLQGDATAAGGATHVRLNDGALAFSGRSKGKPVRMEVSALSLQTGPLDMAGKEAAQLTLSARLRSGQTEPGTLKFKGAAAWTPIQVRGELDAVDIPAHALVPYFADRLNLDILHAEVNLRADGALEEFRANNAVATQEGSTLALGEELLSWKALNVPGIVLSIAPHKPLRLQVREAALTDFFARIAVAPDGQLTASNQVVLNQLAFGAAVDGAPNSLPVKLVTALLADENGMIDIDLPFSLLGGGSGDANASGGRIAFAPGSSALNAQAALALVRGVVVKDYLVAHQFPTDRLFLGSVKVEESANAGNAFQPNAELALTHR
jgi:hypothetical protein